jgi:hypothetical protein
LGTNTDNPFPITGNKTTPDSSQNLEVRSVCFSTGQEINLAIENAQGRLVLID